MVAGGGTMREGGNEREWRIGRGTGEEGRGEKVGRGTEAMRVGGRKEGEITTEIAIAQETREEKDDKF